MCLRKLNKRNDINIKVKDVLDGKFINEAIKSNECYKVLSQIRLCPAFWERKKKELLATVRQLGNPTFFMTVSAAEHSWPELLKMLVMLSTGQNVSDLEILNLNDYDKTSLIRNDPVTCARYFNFKMAKLMILLKSQFGPFQNNWVIDSYQRVEFQQRGSPHKYIFTAI